MQQHQLCCLHKIYKLNQTIQFLPVLYIGNKELDNYVDISHKLLLKRGTDYKIIKNPYLFQALHENYHTLNIKKSICINHMKPIKLSYLSFMQYIIR